VVNGASRVATGNWRKLLDLPEPGVRAGRGGADSFHHTPKMARADGRAVAAHTRSAWLGRCGAGRGTRSLGR